MTTDHIAGPAPERPERGFTFLANEVRRARRFDRAEVEAALRAYEKAGQEAVRTGDWTAWSEQFTDDAIYVEHHFGVMRGREAIRAWITSTMQGQVLDLEFPVEFALIDNDLVFVYVPNRFPAPDGGPGYQFVSATLLCYAGHGRWCYEEDIYNTAESTRVIGLFAAARAEGPGTAG